MGMILVHKWIIPIIKAVSLVHLLQLGAESQYLLLLVLIQEVMCIGWKMARRVR